MSLDSHDPARLPGRLAFRVLLFLALLFAAAPDASAADPSYAGRPLAEVLLELQQAGLELVFTDQVVKPWMHVLTEPAAREPRALLDEILAPQGLAAREGAGGIVMIVRRGSARPLPGRLSGRAVDTAGQPLAGVLVRLGPPERRTASDAEGRFAFEGLAPGRVEVAARRAGLLEQRATVEIEAGREVEIEIEMPAIPTALEAIEVTSSRLRWLGNGISALDLEGRELLDLPQITEDALRPLAWLPGTSSSEISARIHVRGGRPDELMVRLDDAEIIAPYHLEDFSSALSIVPPAVLGEAELLTGGFPAEYGERMGGVLDLRTLTPQWKRHSRAGLSLLGLDFTSSGTWHQERGHWLSSVRVGSLEPALELADEEDNPRFGDAFGKLDLELPGGRLGPQSLRANLLTSADGLDFVELRPLEDDGDETRRQQFRTSYFNVYAWLNHQAILGRDLFAASRLAYSRVERDRRGSERIDGEAEREIEIKDVRLLNGAHAGQDWNLSLGPRHSLEAGFELRALEIDYDYASLRRLADPLAAIRHDGPNGQRTFLESFRGEHLGLYLAERFTPRPDLVLELGLRFDRNTITDDRHLSPRFSAALELDENTRLRLAWGHFFQTQRVYELQVEDGEEGFFPAERAEHRILGLERDLGEITLRAELYERRIRDPRPRFENLYEPIDIVPELTADRVRIAPESARARGFELFLGGRGGRRIDWFVSYAYATTRDMVDGREMRRSIDQPHTVKADVSYRSPWRWDFHLALEWHTGWPTTALDARLVTGEDGETRIEPILGPLYGERLPDYRRLDLKATRSFTVGRGKSGGKGGELELFIEISNLTGEGNVRGFEFDFEVEDDGTVTVERDEKFWGRRLPNLGLRYSF